MAEKQNVKSQKDESRKREKIEKNKKVESKSPSSPSSINWTWVIVILAIALPLVGVIIWLIVRAVSNSREKIEDEAWEEQKGDLLSEFDMTEEDILDLNVASMERIKNGLNLHMQIIGNLTDEPIAISLVNACIDEEFLTTSCQRNENPLGVPRAFTFIFSGTHNSSTRYEFYTYYEHEEKWRTKRRGSCTLGTSTKDGPYDIEKLTKGMESILLKEEWPVNFKPFLYKAEMVSDNTYHYDSAGDIAIDVFTGGISRLLFGGQRSKEKVNYYWQGTYVPISIIRKLAATHVWFMKNDDGTYVVPAVTFGHPLLGMNVAQDVSSGLNFTDNRVLTIGAPLETALHSLIENSISYALVRNTRGEVGHPAFWKTQARFIHEMIEGKEFDEEYFTSRYIDKFWVLSKPTKNESVGGKSARHKMFLTVQQFQEAFISKFKQRLDETTASYLTAEGTYTLKEYVKQNPSLVYRLIGASLAYRHHSILCSGLPLWFTTDVGFRIIGKGSSPTFKSVAESIASDKQDYVNRYNESGESLTSDLSVNTGANHLKVSDNLFSYTFKVKNQKFDSNDFN